MMVLNRASVCQTFKKHSTKAFWMQEWRDELMDIFEYIYSHQTWKYIIKYCSLLVHRFIQNIFLKTYL